MKKSIKNYWHNSIKEIKKEDWSSLLRESAIPFYQWDWLKILEESESVSAQYGWQPLHISLWSNKELVGLAPLYLKSHSFGEFIFDSAFVRLSAHLGLKYYPKLIGMSPFSPVEGYKFFIAKNENEEELTKRILEIIDEFAIKNGILSCNFLYVDPQWKEYIEKQNYLTWINKQPLWSSEGEREFNEYLQRFNSNQRRNIKRERESINKSGISISVLKGNEITPKILTIMHDLYEGHCSKWGPWGSKYLTENFFDLLKNDSLKNNIILFNANKGDPENPIAMSLCIASKDILWGRYWGSKQDIRNLHFEICYYSPISWSIKNGIKKFDPGAGGNHKLRRGFNYTQRFSLHKWYEKRMGNILNEWLPKANYQMIKEINASNNEVPFKNKKINL